MRKLEAPYGFSMTKEIDADDEKAVLEFTETLSDDPEFKEKVRTSTHEERLEQLKKNGFEII